MSRVFAAQRSRSTFNRTHSPMRASRRPNRNACMHSRRHIHTYTRTHRDYREQNKQPFVIHQVCACSASRNLCPLWPQPARREQSKHSHSHLQANHVSLSTISRTVRQCARDVVANDPTSQPSNRSTRGTFVKYKWLWQAGRSRVWQTQAAH